jgi:hypothetical protein
MRCAVRRQFRKKYKRLNRHFRLGIKAVYGLYRVRGFQSVIAEVVEIAIRRPRFQKCCCTTPPSTSTCSFGILSAKPEAMITRILPIRASQDAMLETNVVPQGIILNLSNNLGTGTLMRLPILISGNNMMLLAMPIHQRTMNSLSNQRGRYGVLD